MRDYKTPSERAEVEVQVNGIEEVEEELDFAVVKASDKLLAIADHNLQLTRAFSPKFAP